jgi:HPt (histidine-containing phosphotransfer) domain-containing protein
MDKTEDISPQFNAGDKFFRQMLDAGVADSTFIREIVKMFIEEGNESLKSLKQSIEKDDLQAIQMYAHKLKSSFLIFDMHEAHEIVSSIEDPVLNEQSDNLKKHSQLQVYCNQAFKKLKAKHLV